MEIKLSKPIVKAFQRYLKMLTRNDNNNPLRAHAVNLWAYETFQLMAGTSRKGWTFANVWFSDKVKRTTLDFETKQSRVWGMCLSLPTTGLKGWFSQFTCLELDWPRAYSVSFRIRANNSEVRILFFSLFYSSFSKPDLLERSRSKVHRAGDGVFFFNWDIIDINSLVNLGHATKQLDICTYCKMITSISSLNIHHHTELSLFHFENFKIYSPGIFPVCNAELLTKLPCYTLHPS